MVDDPRVFANVPEVLVPFSEWEGRYADLAIQLSRLAVSALAELTRRDLTRPIQDYADPEHAMISVREGRRIDSSVDHFAVVNLVGNVVGSAYIDHGAHLHRVQPLLWPHWVSFGRIRVYPHAGPMIQGWAHTGDKEDDMLSDVYRDLIFRSGAHSQQSDAPKPWTLEPWNTPTHVFSAFNLSELRSLGTGHWSADLKFLTNSPKILYARLSGEFGDSVHDMRRELRTNKRGLLSILDEIMRAEGTQKAERDLQDRSPDQ